MSRATMDAHNTLTEPALVRAVQCAMVDYLDGAEAVIHVTKPMQQAAYLQGCATLHAAALQAAATTHAADTLAAAVDRLAAAITTLKWAADEAQTTQTGGVQ